MKLWRTIAGLLLSLTLLWAQTTALSASPVPVKKACCGHCHGRVCCAAPAPTPVAPHSTAPQRSLAQTDWQWIAPCHLWTPAPVSFLSANGLTHSLSASAPAVPIFSRDCAFLL